MTLRPTVGTASFGQVLIAHGQYSASSGRLNEAEPLLRSIGLGIARAYTLEDAILRVERGGLAGAVLCGDGSSGLDGISMLRIVRAIARELPCWLVTHHVTRQRLEAALSLSVVSVIPEPLDVNHLSIVLRKKLVDVHRDN